jgi:DNA polymerase-3 subunit delta
MLLALVGSDEFAKDCRIAEFWNKSLVGGSQRKVFFPEGSFLSEMAQALTPALFGPADSVLIRHCEFMAAEEQRRLADFISSKAAGDFKENLALDFYELDKRSVLWKLLEKIKCLEVFSPPSSYGNALQNWVIDHVQKIFQRKISLDAAQYVADAIGTDTKRIHNEIKKIFLYDNSIQEISMQHCQLFIQPDREVDASELRESFGFRNIKVFLPKLRRILSEGDDSASLSVVSALRNQCLNLLHIQAMRAKRIPENDIAARILPPNMTFLYKKNRLPEQSLRWLPAALQKTILRLDEISYGKKISLYNDLPSFELAICALVV